MSSALSSPEWISILSVELRLKSGGTARGKGRFVVDGKAQVQFGFDFDPVLAGNGTCPGRQLVLAADDLSGDSRSPIRRNGQEEDASLGQRLTADCDATFHRTAGRAAVAAAA